MNKFVYTALLVLTLLNFEYDRLQDFDFSMGDILNVAMIVLSIIGLVLEFRKKPSA